MFTCYNSTWKSIVLRLCRWRWQLRFASLHSQWNDRIIHFSRIILFVFAVDSHSYQISTWVWQWYSSGLRPVEWQIAAAASRNTESLSEAMCATRNAVCGVLLPEARPLMMLGFDRTAHSRTSYIGNWSLQLLLRRIQEVVYERGIQLTQVVLTLVETLHLKSASLPCHLWNVQPSMVKKT